MFADKLMINQLAQIAKIAYYAIFKRLSAPRARGSAGGSQQLAKESWIDGGQSGR